ncbi:hypothetical protein SELMODRAFT_412572 [Selaginella moellendorffii]|uniref:Uncharacterized protein n=1 Tax=Selaginella moellendorffii TaxID=88036 RepID=D8RLX2_SELML|nr:hypothetical protein SELMODRAFT_412572 [Selaginella moellendorffii]
MAPGQPKRRDHGGRAARQGGAADRDPGTDERGKVAATGGGKDRGKHGGGNLVERRQVGAGTSAVKQEPATSWDGGMQGLVICEGEIAIKVAKRKDIPYDAIKRGGGAEGCCQGLQGDRFVASRAGEVATHRGGGGGVPLPEDLQDPTVTILGTGLGSTRSRSMSATNSAVEILEVRCYRLGGHNRLERAGISKIHVQRRAEPEIQDPYAPPGEMQLDVAESPALSKHDAFLAVLFLEIPCLAGDSSGDIGGPLLSPNCVCVVMCRSFPHLEASSVARSVGELFARVVFGEGWRFRDVQLHLSGRSIWILDFGFCSPLDMDLRDAGAFKAIVPAQAIAADLQYLHREVGNL